MTGDEQINSQENEQPAAQASPPPPKNHEERSQWIKFGILAAILLGAIVVVALVRPLIFGRVIPAVMGDTQPPAAEATTAPPAAQENEVFIPAASGGGGPEEAATPVEAVVEEAEGEGEGETAVTQPPPDPTAIPATPVTYTVQTGDNLTKIAQQYGVTVQEIIAANNLANGDYISVGQILIIPVPQ